MIFNEIDRFPAQWLKNLFPGAVVEERSIVELTGRDLHGHDRVHMFAGIGGWEYALHLAGWPSAIPVWTGSCPCQPFSVAGRRRGTDDERHLWPHMLRLIRECRPAVCFGEQVASPDGRAWLSDLRADLEGLDYAVGAADLCAAGTGAPHIRQRLYWVAYSEAAFRWWAGDSRNPGWGAAEAGGSGTDGRVADAPGGEGHEELGGPADAEAQGYAELHSGCSAPGGLADTIVSGRQGQGWCGSEEGTRTAECSVLSGHGGADAADSPWRTVDWLFCRDGKWRPVGPGTFPLAHGIPNRVGRLRAYGNAIVPQVAAEFIGAFMDSVRIKPDRRHQ